MNQVDRLLAGVLRGELRWPEPGVAPEAFLERAQLHGVSSLLHDAISRSAQAATVPPAVREALRERALHTAATELGRGQELRNLLRLMAESDVHPILLKGSALAYSHYAQPSLRERSDTDLLVERPAAERLFALLEAQGFRRPPATSGELITSEATFWRNDSAIDVHWRINNSPLLSPALGFDDAAAGAVAIPALGPHARGLGAVDALLLAAVHRAAHHHAPFYADGAAHRGDRLIWLYDLHLLAPVLTPAQCAELAHRAERHRIGGLCLDALEHTRDAFGTQLPKGLMQPLERVAAQREPSMAFLRGSRRSLLLAELLALAGWRSRWRLLREHAFPPAGYMLLKYETRRRWLLPALYVRRALGWLAK